MPSSTPAKPRSSSQAGKPEDDHHRHQHGRPRNRYRTGWQCREAGGLGRGPTENLSEAEKHACVELLTKLRGEWEALHDGGTWRRAGCTSSVPNATSRAASTTSCAGAAGRQGDPGSSRFYLSLEDPLLRIFAGDRVQARSWTASTCRTARRSRPASSHARSRSAQRKVEARNFDIRKQLLEYDDVANDQRKVVYQQRNELLDSERRVTETVDGAARTVFSRQLVRTHVPDESDRGAVGPGWPGTDDGLKDDWQPRRTS